MTACLSHAKHATGIHILFPVASTQHAAVSFLPNKRGPYSRGRVREIIIIIIKVHYDEVIKE